MAIEITCVPLAADENNVRRARARLPAQELARADRFVFPHLRVRYALAHAALRTILARAVAGEDPDGDRDHLPARVAGLPMVLGPWGRPDLASPPPGGLSFNLSHSADRALVAVARGRTVGVDIERIALRRATDDVARRVFSPRERATMPDGPPLARAMAFFRIWVTKEAYIKAHGRGLSLPLDSFDVEAVPTRPMALHATRPDSAEAERWWTAEVGVPTGFLGAVVVSRIAGEPAPPPIVRRDWDWSRWAAR